LSSGRRCFVAGCFWKFGLSGSAFVAAFFCITLVAVSGTDVEHHIIPNRIVLPAAVIVLAANTVLHLSPEWALGALGGVRLSLRRSPRLSKGMGMGDVKLALLMGRRTRPDGPGRTDDRHVHGARPGHLPARAPRSAARKMRIPFGPFLALGSVVALFWGQEVLSAYWSIGR